MAGVRGVGGGGGGGGQDMDWWKQDFPPLLFSFSHFTPVSHLVAPTFNLSTYTITCNTFVCVWWEGVSVSKL